MHFYSFLSDTKAIINPEPIISAKHVMAEINCVDLLIQEMSTFFWDHLLIMIFNPYSALPIECPHCRLFCKNQ